MSDNVVELHPSQITIGAVGPPGRRLFLLQASDGIQIVTLKMEKQQAEMLAAGIDQFLEELEERFPFDLVEGNEPPESDLELQEPFDILFVVGHMGLGYDEENSAVVLVAQELASEDESENAKVARFWASLGQMRALSRHAMDVATRGRAICPICQQPIDPGGHFCPKSNGRQLKQVTG